MSESISLSGWYSGAAFRRCELCQRDLRGLEDVVCDLCSRLGGGSVPEAAYREPDVSDVRRVLLELAG